MGQVEHDHAPLLAPGCHYFSLSEIEVLCVHSFHGAARTCRERLYYALEEFVQRVLAGRFCCTVFVDGSFLTRKPEPDDVDVLVSTELCVLEALNDSQLAILHEINEQFVQRVDSLAMTTYPRGHALFGSALDIGNSGQIYGVEHSQSWLKGYAALRLWETDVGHRICR